MTEEGINDELAPLLRMTMPPGLRGKTVDTVEVGAELGRSWILLGRPAAGRLRRPEAGRARARAALPRALADARVRGLAARADDRARGRGGCRVTDRLSFELKRGVAWIPGAGRLATSGRRRAVPPPPPAAGAGSRGRRDRQPPSVARDLDRGGAPSASASSTVIVSPSTVARVARNALSSRAIVSARVSVEPVSTKASVQRGSHSRKLGRAQALKRRPLVARLGPHRPGCRPRRRRSRRRTPAR